MSHLTYIIICQPITTHHKVKDDTLILFPQKKHIKDTDNLKQPSFLHQELQRAFWMISYTHLIISYKKQAADIVLSK